MKNRSGEKIKLASIDELLGVVNEESYIVINAGPQKHSQTLSKMRSNIHRMEV